MKHIFFYFSELSEDVEKNWYVGKGTLNLQALPAFCRWNNVDFADNQLFQNQREI